MKGLKEEQLPQHLKDLSTDKRDETVLSKEDIMALIKFHVQVRKQFSAVYTTEGRLRPNFIKWADERNPDGSYVYDLNTRISNVDKYALRKVTTTSDTLFTSGGQRRLRAPKVIPDKRSMGKFTNWETDERREIHKGARAKTLLSYIHDPMAPIGETQVANGTKLQLQFY